MLARLLSVRVQAWVLISAVAGMTVLSVIAKSEAVVSSQVLLYVIQPIAALMIAAISYAFTRGISDRIRHKGDRAFAVGSIIAVWGVVYLLSGIAFTYTRNALVVSLASVLLNLLAFSSVAAGIEYARHSAMLLAGRRNITWFGGIVLVVFAFQQMSLTSLLQAGVSETFVRLLVSDALPALATSALLTYLSVTGGLVSQLVYRVGLVVIAIIPPIMPKYDWYLSGTTTVLLALVTYIVLDRHRPEPTGGRAHRYQRHTKPAINAIFAVSMIALVCFMTGVFTYKPVVVMSNSMLPVFARGSVIVVQRLREPVDIQVGDIIQYTSDNKTVTHRVVAIEVGDGNTRAFVTKGDNNDSYDPLVRQEQVIGIIRATVPYLGYPTVWLQEAVK